MTSKYKLVLLVSLLSITFTAQAKIYQWTDSDGQKHFSQTPPPKIAGKKAPKVEVRKEKFKVNRGVKKINDNYYCGKIRLPSSKDLVVQLANVEYSQKNWSKDIQRQQKRITKFTDEQREYDSNPNKTGDNSKIIKRIRNKVVDLQCAYRWSKRQSAELVNVRKDTAEELETVREEYAEIKDRCGESPVTDGVISSNDEAVAWLRCKSSSRKEHNKKLRELKAARNKASILNKKAE